MPDFHSRHNTNIDNLRQRAEYWARCKVSIKNLLFCLACCITSSSYADRMTVNSISGLIVCHDANGCMNSVHQGGQRRGSNYSQQEKLSHEMWDQITIENLRDVNDVMPDSDVRWLYESVDVNYRGGSNECDKNISGINEELLRFEKKCFTVEYKDSGYKSNALLLIPKSRKGNLVVYNHGHDGFVLDNQSFAMDYLKATLEGGSDLLLVYMPFLGLDKNQDPIHVKTWDGMGVYNRNETLNYGFALHGVFELFDTGSSHYIRYFIDSSVLYILNYKDSYKSISYVGLSGGATVGLYTCAALSKIIKNCVLVAGVMPTRLRLAHSTMGDSEQVSSALLKKVDTTKLACDIKKYARLSLVYNENDSCCFQGRWARLFEEDLLERCNMTVVIRDSHAHDFDPFWLASITN